MISPLEPNRVLTAVGLMSGTSMDGIDGVVMKTDGQTVARPVAQVSLSYPPFFRKILRQIEHAIQKSHGDVNEARCLLLKDGLSMEAEIDKLTQFYADIVHALEAKGGKADIVGFHGQTVYHAPQQGVSIQLGNASLLAALTGVPIVSDFRNRDIQMGGQGAPLAPLYHQALVSAKGERPVAVVNCGGIANVTFIWGTGISDLMGFDVGPGNVLLDQLIRERTQGRELMDEDGRHGRKGQVDEKLLALLTNRALIPSKTGFFDHAPPKSLDSRDFVPGASLMQDLSLEDAAATLAAFTALEICRSVRWVKGSPPKTWVLAGGGGKNPVITAHLKKNLEAELGSQVCMRSADDYGWSSTYMEAEIMAFLAVRSVKGMPLTVPATTGVRAPTTGGILSLPKNGKKSWWALQDSNL